MSNKRQLRSEGNPPSGRCLGVFGLSLHTRERDLEEVFSKYGPLEDVQVVYDCQSGRSRGFAFIYYEDKRDAAVAKEKCDGIEIGSNKIAVDYSAQLFSRLIDRLVASKSPNPVLAEENGGGDGCEDNKKRDRNIGRKKSKGYECVKCGKRYSKEQYVTDHMMSVHYKSELNYSCRVCGEAFGWRVTILKHIKRCHPEKRTTDMIDNLF